MCGTGDPDRGNDRPLRGNEIMNANYFTSSGMNPRPLDSYDHLCARYYRASRAGNHAAANAFEKQLLAGTNPGERSEVLEYAYSHGYSLANYQ
jgi:hypothetical protein